MKQKLIFGVAFAVLMILVLLSCRKEKNGMADPAKSHTVKIYLTNHDAPVLGGVFIDFLRAEVKLENNTLLDGG